MAKIFHRKARKDYPEHGIKKGDMYYTAQIKTGPRSSRVLRSLKPLRDSQLTTSPFKSGYYAAQESWDDNKERDESTIRDIAETIRELGTEAQESFDNMPEGLQQGDTGQMLQERAEQCETKADELESLADEYETLEEPQEPDDGEDEDAFEEFSEAQGEYETERERIMEEAGELIGDMPE